MGGGAIQAEARFIRALALISERMIQLGSMLRGDSWERSVQIGCDVRQLDDTVYFNWYADVEVQTSEACCWWFEIQLAGNNWTVVRTVNKVGQHGQESLLELPITEFQSGSALVDAIPKLLSEFVETVSSVDLSNGQLREAFGE